MRVRISLIVPVYNTEKYLDKCLTSLVSQTLDNIEIIIVNDGSSDNSQAIIDKYAGNPDYKAQIVPLKQENSGLGMARNLGVQHANGEYIGFVDSDDWVENDMAELMYELGKAEDSDVVLCDYRCIYDHNNTEKVFRGLPSREETRESVADFVMYSTNPAYSWARIYRKELLVKTPFPAGYYEDIATTPIILSNCEKISYVKKPLYNYLRRDGTISANRFTKRNLEVIKAWKRCFEQCNPKYLKEVAYAIYYSVSEFIEYKPDCFSEYLGFFRENISSFENNDYIKKAIADKKFRDLFSIGKALLLSGGALSPIAQTIGDFLSETKVLTEQADSLPPDTVAELCNMYNTMLAMAAKNIIDVGEGMMQELCTAHRVLHTRQE